MVSFCVECANATQLETVTRRRALDVVSFLARHKPGVAPREARAAAAQVAVPARGGTQGGGPRGGGRHRRGEGGGASGADGRGQVGGPSGVEGSGAARPPRGVAVRLAGSRRGRRERRRQAAARGRRRVGDRVRGVRRGFTAPSARDSPEGCRVVEGSEPGRSRRSGVYAGTDGGVPAARVRFPAHAPGRAPRALRGAPDGAR